MELAGTLKGLAFAYAEPIDYYLPLGEGKLHLNALLGKELQIRFLQEIECIACGRKIKKTFNNGYCYPCFKKLPENDLCIVKPHECHYDKGTCRDARFGENHCLIPHYVYLAVTSDVKVGLTRKHHQVKRWIDQGAVRAIPIAELPNRRMAGELEFHLSRYLPDKTNWRKMLQGGSEEIDLLALREEVYAYFPDRFKPYILRAERWLDLVYPLKETAAKIKAFHLEKQTDILDELLGMKGQYLIFRNGVLNVKKFSGYKVRVKCFASNVYTG
ncbi:DUF2797 domain-containing protein [Bacillaceae bacterium]